jgi:hypothetical protein
MPALQHFAFLLRARVRFDEFVLAQHCERTQRLQALEAAD